MSSSLKRKRSAEDDEEESTEDVGKMPDGTSKSRSNGAKLIEDAAPEIEEEGSLEEEDEDEDDQAGEEQEAGVQSTSSQQEIGQQGKDQQQQQQEQPQEGQPPQQTDWQAIYSPPHNAYYFYNTKTQETTWKNPLESAVATTDSSSASATNPGTATSLSSTTTTVDYPSGYSEPTASTSSAGAIADTGLVQGYGYGQAAAVNPALEGIDPELAYLDPSLSAGVGGAARGVGTFSARFNAHTGRFTAVDGRDPTHLSEYERMKRMSSVFFDFGAWEQEVAERKAREAQEEAEGRRRKNKPTKADLERFKAQKEARKKTKYAWLRE
ncbi:hypothetical protein FRC17_008312 [Serendipita sp. 399]|nr:hypothetical protein FRC17_008312 [Serendipita sp. 399]